MIIDLTKDNLNILDNSFIDKTTVKNEFNNNPFAKYLLLIEDNEIIGYIYYSDIYDRVEINQFEINAIHRNCGKGSYLLKKFTEKVEKDISLEVKKNNYQAIKIYQKNGFEKVAIREKYYNGIDGILMIRKYK